MLRRKIIQALANTLSLLLIHIQNARLTDTKQLQIHRKKEYFVLKYIEKDQLNTILSSARTKYVIISAWHKSSERNADW